MSLDLVAVERALLTLDEETLISEEELAEQKTREKQLLLKAKEMKVRIKDAKAKRDLNKRKMDKMARKFGILQERRKARIEYYHSQVEQQKNKEQDDGCIQVDEEGQEAPGQEAKENSS